MSDKPPRLILVADRDKDSAAQLGEALKKRGYGVVYTYDGSNSIEVVITHLPDLVFYDAALPLIHFKKFIQIVRSNPRTMHIPIIIVGRATDKIGFSTLTESKINKPYDINSIMKMVENIFHKIDTADMLKSSTKAFEGKLSEISLPDLMQVFALNKKTGVLKIKNRNHDASIYLRNGEIIHAQTGKIFGEKAIYRLLGISEGDFIFQPDVVSDQISLRSTIDNILMEGMRQLDESKKIIAEHFSGNDLYVRDEIKIRELSGLHPIAEDVISELKDPKCLDEILDSLHYPDLEILTTLRSLIVSGAIKVVSLSDVSEIIQRIPSKSTGILNEEEWRALSYYLNENFFKRYSISTTVVGIVCPNRVLLKKFIRVLKTLSEIELYDYNFVIQFGYGRLGHIRGINIDIDIYLVPINKQFFPFRRLLDVRMIGLLLITSSAAQNIVVNAVIDSKGTNYLNYMPVLNVVVPMDDVVGVKDLTFVDASLEIGENKEPPTRYDISKPEEFVLLVRRFISSIIKKSVLGC
ncbi:MAG: DUF4388 domain-containing protein [Deltaproteobacteria bacterium]|nr:DUF4388 domain-containing protein [Deltaproteobacteria bacterium]